MVGCTVAAPGPEVQVPVRVRGMPVRVRMPVEPAAERHPEAERAQRDEQDPPTTSPARSTSDGICQPRSTTAADQEEQQRVTDREADRNAHGMRGLLPIVGARTESAAIAIR